MARDGARPHPRRRPISPLGVVAVTALVIAALLTSATVTAYAFGLRDRLWPPWPFS